ncbi:MAG: hypothetical protein EHM47_08140 [Ignavibacteriales bacterium]|nr:MAG: hypothetical protein EHM47_08140 [Ignavibacteriales bacterium]
MRYDYPGIILFILIINAFVFPQVDWRINSEVGLFKSSGYGILREESLLTRFDGFIKYVYEEDKKNASLSLRVRPEFYGSDNPINSIKLKAEGGYFQVEENFNWGLNVTGQKNFFNDVLFDFTYDVFTVVGDAAWYYFGDLTLNTNAGYAYQKIKGNEKYKLDLFFADLKLISPVSSSIKFGYGFYFERFFIRNEIDRQNILTTNRNDGIRLGPQLNINYIRDFIINIDYRMLVHESDFIEYFSYEHWIRAVAGKIFFNYWSIFLLVDYNSYHFKKNEDYIEGITPLYTPLNLENRIYLKIAYELSNNFELYTKGGYFKDNLYEDTFSLEGWNALIGIEFNGGM